MGESSSDVFRASLRFVFNNPRADCCVPESCAICVGFGPRYWLIGSAFWSALMLLPVCFDRSEYSAGIWLVVVEFDEPAVPLPIRSPFLRFVRSRSEEHTSELQSRFGI